MPTHETTEPDRDPEKGDGFMFDDGEAYCIASTDRRAVVIRWRSPQGIIRRIFGATYRDWTKGWHEAVSQGAHPFTATQPPWQ